MADTVPRQDPPSQLFRRAFFASLGFALVVALGLTLWQGSQILFLAFAGILLAILLRAPADWLHRRIHVPEKLAIAAEIVGTMGLLGLAAWMAAPSVGDQISTLRQEIPRSVQQAREKIEKTELGRAMTGLIPAGSEIPWGRVAGQAAGLLSTVAGVIFASIVVLVVGLFVSLNPAVYRENAIRLIPPARRERAGHILREMGETLRSWLLGRLVGMAFIGVTTGVGLWLLGAPLALTLGVLAGLLAFIPNIGPVLSAIPAILLAMTQGWSQVALVVGLYVVLQAIDNNIVTPLIEQRMVHLPPAFTGLAQILLGLLFGVLGLFLATPLTACAVILVRRIYVEDALERGGAT